MKPFIRNITFYSFLGISVLICLILIFWFVGRFHALGGRERMHSRQSKPVITVDQIHGWMTFDYINHTFNVPAFYTQKKLIITSTKYPYMTVDALANEKGITSAILLVQLKGALNEYMASTTVNLKKN
jgi:hypothetical protein